MALARSLVVEPSILLLDEPLSNLDAKLRERMRAELKTLQRRTGITFIYVTHDQAEAMALSDRIVVFNKGRVQQVGTPRAVYERPANLFVADFMGLVNKLPGKLIERRGGEGRVQIGAQIVDARLSEDLDGAASTVTVAIRPEAIRFGASEPASACNVLTRSARRKLVPRQYRRPPGGCGWSAGARAGRPAAEPRAWHAGRSHVSHW